MGIENYTLFWGAEYKKKGGRSMTKRFGFTLAEVLITLGIIGVVAAMTIPTLISNTNGAQFKTAYKKALSTLNQAVLMNLALDDTDLSTLKKDEDGATPDGSMSALLGARLQSATEITDTYFSENGAGATVTVPAVTATCTTAQTATGSGHVCEGNTADNPTYELIGEQSYTATTAKVYSFADGTAFGYRIGDDAVDCTDNDYEACTGFIDVNGSNKPNVVINCPNATSTGCDASEVMDIYPVVFHGQTIEPATDSARAVLFGK